MKRFRKLRHKKLLGVLLSVIIIVILAGGTLVCASNYYMKMTFKKENNLLLFQSDSTAQDIYILGTIHGSHFEQSYNYSLADIQSAIDTIQPDILLVEVRQDTVQAYAALDGPMEMVFAWCYAKEKGIEVKGIDWWQVTEEAKTNYTNAERDDRIFDNILLEIEGNQKVLILCGATHRIEQGKRFADNGYRQINLKNIGHYFDTVSDDDFTYPETMLEEMKTKMEYCEAGLIEEINANTEEGGSGRETWLQKATQMQSSIDSMINELIIPNRLYIR